MSAAASSRLLQTFGLAALAAGLLLSPRASAVGLFEKNHPQVERGKEAYDAGQYDEALRAFDEAKKEMPNNAAVEFNRGNALAKLGRLEEARDAFHRVGQMDQGDLRASDLYNLGNVWAQLGNTQEAIASYRRALTLDPKDAQARHNLEVLLRRLPPPKQQGQDGGTDGGQDAGKPDAGGADAGRPDAGPDGGQDGGVDGGQDGGSDGGMDGGSDGGQGDGGQGDGGTDGGQDKKDRGDAGGSPDDQERRDGGQGDQGVDAGTEEPDEADVDGGTPLELNKKDAERLLDSMKQNEKNLQLWRFQQKKKQRKPNEKDW